MRLDGRKRRPVTGGECPYPLCSLLKVNNALPPLARRRLDCNNPGLHAVCGDGPSFARDLAAHAVASLRR
jgi:hypothetical protein